MLLRSWRSKPPIFSDIAIFMESEKPKAATAWVAAGHDGLSSPAGRLGGLCNLGRGWVGGVYVWRK